mgnify:FL=1
MTQAVRYYVSRKNAMTWIAALMSVAAVALQILALCFGEAAQIRTVNIWFQKALPIAALLLFVMQILIWGDKSLYRTTTPVFWVCVYFGQIALDLHLHGGYALFGYMRYVVVCWILYLGYYLIYRFIMTGRITRPWVFSLITLLPLAALTYDCLLVWNSIELWYLMDKLSNICMVGALFLMTLAMRRFMDGKYHRTWGDRSDGRRVRTINGMSVVANYIMPNRNGASNSIQDTVEITNIERYIHKKRKEGFENFGITHVFLAAYVRCIAKYPGCNRFLSGQRVYQRDDDIQFTMAIKKDMSTEASDTMIKLHLTQTDTSKEVYEKFNKVYEEVKNTPLDSSFDHVASLLASLPGLLLKFVVWFLKVMDYFGKIPKFLLEVSPFHASVIFTSMGSLGIPPIVHHLYDFGNLPVFVAFGRKYRKVELDLTGKPVTHRYVDFVLNCDERTVDGFYYATVLKYFQKLLRNPEVLDEQPEEIKWDIA